ncbi:Uncharacterised protein [Enterobacter cloacae]|nr:Uncharacterised protein [Enterobacter cloacae]
MTLMHFQFAFKQFKQREGISRAACETGDHFVVIKTTYFLHVAFHDGITQRGLAITGGGFNPRRRVECSLCGQPLSNGKWCRLRFLCL